MLETFKVQFSSGSYEIEIGSGIPASDGTEDALEVFQIIDSNVNELWPKICKTSAIKIPALEENKTLFKVAEVIESLRVLGANRQSLLSVYGGGIVQDIATFVASSYMRGIPWVYSPTTLLSMVDSCIGGKSSLNVGIYKNIAGNFYPPQKIKIDTNFCNTLEPTELIAGLCEASKICFSYKGGAFDNYLDIFKGVFFPVTQDQLHQLICLSLLTKKRYIEEDEFDQGVRLLLNFGHTFGHAIEAGTNFLVTHGVAVGLGMLAEIELSRQLGFLVAPISRVKKLQGYITTLMTYVPDLHKNLTHLSIKEAAASFKSDKKHEKDFYHLILTNRLGELERAFIPKAPEIDCRIESIFAKIQKGFNFEV
jgi:3-dehydroquinate synthase